MRAQGCYRRIGIIAKRPPSTKNHSQGPQAYQGRENGVSYVGSEAPSTIKFSLDVHPLETLASLKSKVAAYCNCTITAVKPIQINGRAAGTGGRSGAADPAHMNLNFVPEDSVIDELGIGQGCEVVFVIAERPLQGSTVAPPATTSRTSHLHDMSGVFFSENSRFADKLFDKLLGILEALPWPESDDMTDTEAVDAAVTDTPESDAMADTEAVDAAVTDTHKLVWDLLLAMRSNTSIASQVRSLEGVRRVAPSIASDDDAMEVESLGATWSQHLDIRSVAVTPSTFYVLLTYFCSQRQNDCLFTPPSNDSQWKRRLLTTPPFSVTPLSSQVVSIQLLVYFRLLEATTQCIRARNEGGMLSLSEFSSLVYSVTSSVPTKVVVWVLDRRTKQGVSSSVAVRCVRTLEEYGCNGCR
jgi:hypothetical protein